MYGTSAGAGSFVNTALDSSRPAPLDLLAERVGKGLGRQVRIDGIALKMEVGVEFDQGLASASAEDVEADGSQPSAPDADGIGRDVR
jgi:hypothetical protein